MQNTKTIAIIGGGPGGLVLARLLHLRGLAATIFELDEHPLARPQGGSLDLHTASGLRAVREAGLEAGFLAVARYDDQGGSIYDKDGVCHFDEDGEDGDRPEIDRTQLRALLLDSLPAGAVRWNSKVKGVERAGDRWRVVGEDGGDLGVFDLVVGADGAWSKVRPLLSQHQPAYLGLLCYELMIDLDDAPGSTVHQAVAALLPHGKITVVGEGRGFIAQRSSGGHIRVYVMVRTANVDDEPIDLSSPSRAREQLQARLGFSPSMLTFIAAANDTITRRPIVALPVGHSWEPVKGLTLVGDAAHVMSPFSGEGVNMALLDGLELALALTSTNDWSAAVADAEARMFARAADAAEGANGAALTWPAQTLEFIAEGGDPHGLLPRKPSVAQTPQHLFDTQLTAATRNPATRDKVKAVYRFDLTGPRGGSWVVDFKDASAGVRRGSGPAQCAVTMSDDDFVAMATGTISPRRAFMSGKLKIDGNMGLAMKLSALFTPTA